MRENSGEENKVSESKKAADIDHQLQLIHKLATRLPWIVLGISLFAFVIIFLQIFLAR